jgi:5-methylthioadenosine/S-adenosylhomocysteine deaminase
MPVANRFAVTGRVVTMDASSRVIDNGVVYVDGPAIVDVRTTADPPPDGFGSSPNIATGGTIYPGLVELHNHLSYNPLPLWAVPKKYLHRGQWASAPEKREFIAAPMEILAGKTGYVEAVVRYVECKCLLAGVTTSQGLTLSPAPGIEKRYRGLVRNVEATTDESTLPAAAHRIGDVADAAAFEKLLRKEKSCYLLHLSEGVTAEGGSGVARQQFLNLELPGGTWAITSELAGIHSAGLLDKDFKLLGDSKAAMVWSPLSNLLLYGETARVKAARDRGVRIALGSDWSPSGSKNLLGELKVARLYSQIHADLFSDRELVAMATIDAARILKWEKGIGSIEPQKRADLLVISSAARGPYEQLLSASEAAVALVVIDGVPRYGLEGFMTRLGVQGEPWDVLGTNRTLHLADPFADSIVGKLTLEEARDRLRNGLANLKHLPDVTPAAPPVAFADGSLRPVHWRLVLDNDGPRSRELRPLAPLSTAEVIADYWAASVRPEEVVPDKIDLDELTVAENPSAFFGRLQPQINLPMEYKQQLPGLYQP